MIQRRDKVGILDFSSDEFSEDDEVRYCKHCLGYGFQVRLKNRIYPEGQPIPPDHDLFRQCWECGTIYGLHEIQLESKLKSDTDQHVEENPFDLKKGIISGIPKRTSKEGRLASSKRLRQSTGPHHKDKDIDREIRNVGEENVNIIQDTDP